jgi:2-keto-3-deoxy-L-rhamnonate aldolase RhmA
MAFKKRNALRELLKADRPTIGTHVHSQWPGIVEVIGHSGLIDYIEFSGEYAPWDLFSLENFGRAVELFPHMSSMIKIDQEPRTFIAQRAIGSGIQNLLFADVRTPEEALLCVRSSRAETPEDKGIVGVGMRRDIGYLFGPGSPEYVQQLREGVVALMIEKKEAILDLENVLSVGGIDMIQFGPADFSMSIGRPGQYGHPEIVEAQKYAVRTAIKMGIRPRIEIGEFREAEPWIEMGVRDFCIGWDVRIIYDYCRKQGAELAKMLGR